MVQFVFTAFLCLLLSASVAFGQNVGTGIYQLGSFDNKGFDTINLGNLNQHFTIPVVYRKGRGTDFSYNIVYEGLIWTNVPSSSGGNSSWMVDPSYGFHGQLGDGSTGYLTYTSKPIAGCQTSSGSKLSRPGGFTRSNFIFHDSLGLSHLFDYGETVPCGSTGNADTGGVQKTGSGTTYDGSGFTYNGQTVTSRYGDQIVPTDSALTGSGGSQIDTNGNTIIFNSNGTLTDTTGQTALTITGTGTPSSPKLFTYPVALQSSGATTASVQLIYKAYTVQSNFQCSGINESGANPNINLLDRIILPDDAASTYIFSYEATPSGPAGNVTGRLKSITLPTGGLISYGYSAGCPGGINGDGTPVTLTRTTSDGQKLYGRNLQGYPLTTGTTVDESGNRTDFTFQTASTGLIYETESRVYPGSSNSATPLLDRITRYNGATGPAQTTAPITQINIIDSYDGGSVSEVIHDYNTTGQLTLTQYKDSSAGNLLLAETDIAYDPNAKRPSQTLTKDGSGNVIAATSYGYDESATTAPTTAPPPGTWNTPAAHPGNLTSVHVATSGSNQLTTTVSYFNTGIPSSSSNPNGTTTYSYDSTQAFNTSTVLPVNSLTTSATFDAASGLQKTSTGLNSSEVTTFAQYDKLLRLKQQTTPAPQNGVVTYTYALNQVGVVTKIDANSSADTETFLDAYGRVSRTAVSNGTSWYLTDSCYNAVGLLQIQTTAYMSSSNSGAIACTNAHVAYVYDALGRNTSTASADGSSVTSKYVSRSVLTTSSSGASGAVAVQRISQYDALNRLKAVCELSANGGTGGPAQTPVSCQADQGGTGFLTTYTYDLANHKTTVLQGAQTRTAQTDLAGRIVQTTEPERGMTTYTYGYNSMGLLVSRMRPAANQSSSSDQTTAATQYDGLGRVMFVTYSDSATGNPVSTPNRTFMYDQSLNIQGVSGGAYLGRLTTVSNGVHQRNFVYDGWGRVTNQFDCLPDWCQQSAHDVYRSYTYNSIDLPSTESYGTQGNGAVPATVNYAYNSAAQLSSVTQGLNGNSPAPLWKVLTFTPFGPGTDAYGNGVNSLLSYDAVGRLTGRWFCSGVAGVSCPNGTYHYGYAAQQNGGQVQFVSDTALGRFTDFTYDEFGRLVGGTPHSGNSGLSFSASYDRYGNRWSENVTGATSVNTPRMFDQTSNHITTGGNVYDAAGNLWQDVGCVYNYDAEGNLVTISGCSAANYVYDALNERVKSTENANAPERYGFSLFGRRSTTWPDSGTVVSRDQYYNDAGPMSFWTVADQRYHFEHQDWLGTERLITNTSGTDDTAFQSFPFGELSQPSGPNYNLNHFALLDQDLLNVGTQPFALLHAHSREYSTASGRWTSPDPFDGSYDASDPQSNNRYSYVGNNPLGLNDPSGQDDEGGCEFFCDPFPPFPPPIEGPGPGPVHPPHPPHPIRNPLPAPEPGPSVTSLASSFGEDRPDPLPGISVSTDWNPFWAGSLGLQQPCLAGTCGSSFTEGRKDPAPIITVSMGVDAVVGALKGTACIVSDFLTAPVGGVIFGGAGLGTVKYGRVNLNVTNAQVAQAATVVGLTLAVTEGFCHGFFPSTPPIISKP